MPANAPTIVDGEEHLGLQVLCVTCKEFYPQDEEFYKNPENPLRCRACEYDRFNRQERARKKAWYWRNAESQKEKARQAYAVKVEGK
jgi:hypothetical protein